MDTMMALSFGQMISGHVQGPYGEPKFAPIMGYRSVGDERGLFFKLLDSNSNSNLQIQTSFVSYAAVPLYWNAVWFPIWSLNMP